MKLFLSLLIIFTVAAILAPRAHAIIFLPAIILIPIAKIVAVVIGGFSFPALGIGAVWSKLFGKSLKRTIFILVVILIVIALALMFILKIQNPDRPLL